MSILIRLETIASVFSSPVQKHLSIEILVYAFLGFHVFVYAGNNVVLVEHNNFLITYYNLHSICACDQSYKK